MNDLDGVGSELDAYSELVATWAPRMDLIAPRDLPRFRERHIDDCLRLLPLLQELPAGTAVDVGSGAGLPGIVLAIAAPDRPWRLLEPRVRRAGFLEEVVRRLGLAHVEVFAITAQQAAGDPALRGAHVLASARAVAGAQESLDLLRPLLSRTGTSAVFVGKTAQIPPGAEEWQRGIILQHAEGKGHFLGGVWE
jgi:16S rRNA (guanine527-N7)-methyltransferase